MAQPTIQETLTVLIDSLLEKGESPSDVHRKVEALLIERLISQTAIYEIDKSLFTPCGELETSSCMVADTSYGELRVCSVDTTMYAWYSLGEFLRRWRPVASSSAPGDDSPPRGLVVRAWGR